MRIIAFGVLTSISVAAGNWEAMGPFGGPAAIVQVDDRRPGTVLAATANALLFRSRNHGDSWNPLPFPAELRATLHAFVVDPRGNGAYFAGLSSATSTYSGIFVSSDEGASWSRLTSPALRSVWSIALYPQDSNIMAAGTEEGVYLSRDRGVSWTRITPEDSVDMRPIVSLSFDPADQNIIYAGTPHLAWKTRNGGETWDSIHKGMQDDSDVFSILVDDRQRRRVFAGTCGGIYRSIDGGSQWYAVPQPKGVSSRTYFLAQHPQFPNVLFAGTASGLLRSIDYGARWEKLSSNSTRHVAFDPAEPIRLFVATDAGLFRSEDLGDNLEEIDQGFSNLSFTSLAGTGSTLYLHSRYVNIAAMLEREHGDFAWRELGPAQPALQVLKITISESGLFYGTTGRDLLVSSDHARSWAPLPAPATEATLDEVLFASADGNTVLATAEDVLFRTADAGESWSIARPLPETEMYSIVSTESNGLLAASSRGLLRSRDGGQSWLPEAGELSRGTVRAICKHPTRAGILFASQYGNVYESRDNGHSWKRLNEEGGLNGIQALAIVAGNPDCLFALIQNRGVYRIPITGH